MNQNSQKWICCQIGAREHYAIPRALDQHQKLSCLITDTWVTDNSIFKLFKHTRLKERYHPDLATAPITAFTPHLIAFEAKHRYRKTNQWARTIDRNQWFQQRALNFLGQINREDRDSPILFAYSYAALKLFRYAKTQGWQCILGQIDPGPIEEQIVITELSNYPRYQPDWEPAPQQYWVDWQEECELADRIIVNSLWSSNALQQIGISASKLQVIPLAYEPPESAQYFHRQYPTQFSSERPLRVLFLGQIILRKGLIALLEAASLLKAQPIEFWMVGSANLNLPKAVMDLKNIHWISSVPRSVTSFYYQNADIFLFPTLSDGFGLTQLEAQAWKLPIITSWRCGDVVQDQRNGFRMTNLSGAVIADVLLSCLKEPNYLQQLSKHSTLEGFGLKDLQSRLTYLTD